MNSELPANTTLSHYRIVSKIGAGGMGEVYLAQDTKLDRKVAIKFLHEEFSKDADKLGRFIQEAKAASALNHPNILTVYEIGEVDGKNYIATELIDGKTLREHLSHKESLQLNEILKIGVQVSEGLVAAHQAGIIHRDIKPENIMLRKDGYAKVLDFGLAKLTEKKQTEEVSTEGPTRVFVNTTPGIVMGTVSYMSPEQARGKETDERTDIWSLGVVLYEMVAGRVPFTGETVNHTIVSILEKEPLLLENVPGELQRIIRKSLTKDLEMRYQSARDLLIDLKNLRRDLDIQGELERSFIPNRAATTESANESKTQVYAIDSVAATSSGQAPATQDITNSSSSLEYAVTQAKSHKLISAIVGLVLLTAISGVVYFAFASKRGTKQIESIAVMPFVNESGNPDVEYLSDGMTETLIKSLSQLPNLSVKARSSVFRYKGRSTDSRTIGAELGVKAILNGRVVQRRDQLTLSLELIDAQTENVLWSEQYDRRQSDLVTMQTEIAKDVSSKLQTKLSGTDEAKLTKTFTSNSEAYQLYLKGRYYWNKRSGENLRKAIEQFTAAAEKDPNYALAYSGLADCYVVLPYYDNMQSRDAFPQAKTYAVRAVAIDDQLAEAHTSLAYVNQGMWIWAEAEKEYKRAIELNPNYATAQFWYARLQLRLGRIDEGFSRLKLAQQLEPFSLVIADNLIGVYLSRNDVNSAYEENKRLIELDPNYPTGPVLLSYVYIRKGQNREALAEAEKGVELAKRANRTLVGLVYALSASGKRREAIALVKELQEKYAKSQADGAELAGAFAGLGEKDEAFGWLEKSFQDHSSLLVDLRIDPSFAPLRDDPRYKDLLKRMGLPE